MRYLIFVVAVFFCVTCADASTFSYERVVLVRVVDGDTVRLDVEVEHGLIRKNVACRLLRVDAPEMSAVNGVAVKTALSSFLTGKTLRMGYDKPDSFGRWLIELWADGQNVSDWLLTNEFAKPY